ncbi:TetR/AcrR family transcriptional regulator [Aeromicrobium chenweiae]|uniref:TetR family transcriptional regulator n=1 Tax=Aeromicrobium chenweiae TaxID=2079793 RepID=A0A2S0WLT2_9ACTN|nr:TetR/AcrR family transcriptional regulator [Aeromicrobium chenweiae]AWB92271.1 TetR family transcriptional regulator [Aeromicrobium chenweiae]TGN31446.1 TetR/AcrR family transcriptional regulator [Aeromicrobium chenweiae]
MTPIRQLRADAARNRELLLAAAEDEFAERGLAASISDIARRAGVAKGTVFRHFATKEELVAAIVCEQLDALAEVARSQLSAPDPEVGLVEFLTVTAARQHERDLSFLQAVTQTDSAVTALRDELHALVEQLVGRARDAGVLRSDVTGTDVWVLMCAPIHAVGYVSDPAPDLWRRYLALIFDGLRPDGAHPLPAAPPTWP